MDKGGRIIGMIIFIMGIVILLFVFGMAYGMFTAPASQVFGSPASVTAMSLGSTLALVFIRIGLLFVMTLAGSLVAARGVHMYVGSSERRRVE